ncbi:MAG: hypothetical protein ACOYBX_08385 [Mycobacterium sp.]
MGKTLGSMAAVAAALLGTLSLPATPAAAESPVCSAKKCAFVSPNHTVCTIAADAAGCGWTDGDKLYAVKLFPNGGLDPCLHLVDIPGRKCDTYPAGGLPLLGYGQPAVLGPYTCLVDAQSVTCTVMPSGRGFTMNSAGIVPAAVAPPPPPPSAAPSPSVTPSTSPAPEVTALAPAPDAAITVPEPAPVDQPLIPPPPEDMPPPVLPGPGL